MDVDVTDNVGRISVRGVGVADGAECYSIQAVTVSVTDDPGCYSVYKLWFGCWCNRCCISVKQMFGTSFGCVFLYSLTPGQWLLVQNTVFCCCCCFCG